MITTRLRSQKNSETTELPQKEFQLLYLLLSYPNKILTRIQLMDEIWGMDSDTGNVEESLNRLAEELQNTEMLRSDFINNFSHEFKTPIVSILGFSRLLKKGCVSEKEQQEYLDIIEEESLRLSQMATNVLDMTKVENQTILTNVETFNLSEQIRNCLLLLEKSGAIKILN